MHFRPYVVWQLGQVLEKLMYLVPDPVLRSTRFRRPATRRRIALGMIFVSFITKGRCLLKAIVRECRHLSADNVLHLIEVQNLCYENATYTRIEQLTYQVRER